ncbi:hypothetical protein BH09BAC1_BH09BAC1_28450 [soil metagenome]
MFSNFTKNLFFSMVLLLSANTIFAQGTPVADTVVLGANYTNQVYYSLVSGQKSIAPKNEWDIAFQANGITFGVWINEASAPLTSVYVVPAVDATDWGTAVDTTGYATWQRLHNGTDAWAHGAFNTGAAGFDVGWGVYTGPPAHEVNGDSIYLVKLNDGSFKLLYLENLNVNRYKFRFSDIDGTNIVVDSVAKNNDRLFSYYNLRSGIELDREPANNNWDLWFTTGLTANVVAGPPGTPPTAPAGTVYANRGIQSSRVTGIPSDSTDYTTATYDSSISNIYNTYVIRNSVTPPGFWEVLDSNTYFVKAKNNLIYKIVFTGFGGSPDGVIAFEKTQLTFETVGISNANNATRVALYPNPAIDQLTLVMDATEAGMHKVVITDLTGKVTYSTEVSVSGLQHFTLPVSTFANGYYLVSVEANGNRSVQKFVKQ